MGINDDNSSQNSNSKISKAKEDEDDEDDNQDMDQLNQPQQFQYSRSVTPDVSALIEDKSSDNIPSNQPPIELNKTMSSNLGITIPINTTIRSNASKSSVPSESPLSDDYRNNLNVTDYQ